MLQNLRNHLRLHWLVFRRDLKAAFTVCQRCKALGAYPCSICACIPLCDHCSREESIRLDKRTNVNGVNTTGGTPSAPFGKWTKRR